MRVQTADRTVNATDEEAALVKIQAELEQPYGFFGRWETTATEAEIVEARPTVTPSAGVPLDGPTLLSVKDAAEDLGLARAKLYELLSQGELEHVQVGRRKFISRQALARFVEENTRTGR